jgi:hypothetical protein
LCFPSGSPGEAASSGEYQVKAAFLYNLARFVDWPAAKFRSPDSPLLIGVMGDNPFDEDLVRLVANKMVDRHPIGVVAVNDPAGAARCHVVFFSRSMKQSFDQLLPALGEAHVLTVSDIEKFARRHGMVGLVLENERVKLEISPKAAAAAGLTLSSQLLRIARLVPEATP